MRRCFCRDQERRADQAGGDVVEDAFSVDAPAFKLREASTRKLRV
jgi:hypothetical protein